MAAVTEPSIAETRAPGGLSLRGRLVLLVVASLLPLLVLSLWLQYVEYRNTVASTGRQTLDLARSLAHQVEQDLQQRVTALQVLAQSRALRLDDLNGFRARANDLATEIFPGENVVLLRRDGWSSPACFTRRCGAE